MKSIAKILCVVASLSASALVHAQSAWSNQDYDLYPGDFNGDGLTDMLYVAKDPSQPSGIVLSDGAGLNTPLQSWSSDYLGIPWSMGLYNVVVADFNGDGKADILMQRTVPGDHYLLLTDDSGVSSISQTIPEDAAGLSWSADQHHLVAGDFNGDGKADVFLQPTDPKGLSAVVLADANGQITAKQPDQSWNEGYAGFNWSTSEVAVFAGDFNGDGLTDLLVQAQPLTGTGPGTAQPAEFLPNSNGVTLVQASKQIFALEGVQAWSLDGFSANWSPLASSVLVGDFNADGRSDVLLQGLTSQDPNYLLYGQQLGPIFASASAVGGDVLPAAESYVPVVGHFTSDKGSGLYFQSTTLDQPNFLVSIANATVTVKQADAALPVPTDSPAMAEAAASVPNNSMAAALATVNVAGRTPGRFSVSQMGAATYQIPIWVPHGPRGIQPSLAITYSSQSGDGVMGPGWNIAGLGAITRCNKTYKEDTTPAAVYLATTDGYCLNGSRLRVTSGTYGAAGSTYQTEIADFSLVTANGTAGNGPSSFTVKGKNGLIYEYGNTADSRILYGTTAGQWLINKVSDRSGNNYIVTYGTGATGSVDVGVPLSVSYTPVSSGSSTYNYAVTFTYSTKDSQVPGTTDPALVGYVGGVRVVNTNLLLGINVSSSSSGSSVLVRTYTMGYGAAPTTTRARLTSVQECGGSAGTDCLSPTIITYQDGQSGISSTSNTAVSNAPQNYVDSKYDLNGDGYSDVLYYNGTNWMVAFGSATGYGAPVNTGAAGNGLPSDVLGNGRDGILAVNGSTWYYYTWNGTAFVGTSTGLAADSAVGLADINGDGLPDLVYFSAVYGASGSISITSRLNTSSAGAVHFSSTLNSAWSYSGSLGSATLYHPDLPYMGPLKTWDFNGDGREDLALVYKDTSVTPAIWNYVTLLGSGTGFGTGQIGTSSTSVPPSFKFLNWNNDACADVQYGNSILISGCGGAQGSTITLPSSTYLTAADWNGDGRTDVLIANGSTIGVYLSTSTGFSSLISTSIPYSSTCAYYTFDANGDGLDDLMCWDQLGTLVVKYYLHNGPGQPPDLVASITDGYGVVQSPTYVSIVQNNFTKSSDGAYPDKDVVAPMYIVNQFSASDGTGSTFTNSFWYYGAHSNLQGLGFDGFRSMRTQDSRNGTYRYQYFERDFPKRGMVFEDDLYQSDGTTFISYLNLTNVVTTLDSTTNNQRYFPNTSNTLSRGYELGPYKNGAQITSTTGSYTYDGSGNVTGSTTVTTDTDSTAPASPYNTQTWTTTVANTISPNTANWCLNLPTQTTVTKSSTTATGITRTVGFTPDYVNCRITQRVVEPANATYKVTEDLHYDAYGNIDTDTITGINMTARQTKVTWSTGGQFPIAIYDPKSTSLSTSGYKEVRGYDFDKGVLTSDVMQSYDGLTNNAPATTWQYDSFARQTQVTRPDGTYTTTDYTVCGTGNSWCGTSNSSTDLRLESYFKNYASTGGTPINQQYRSMDGFERVRFKKHTDLAGAWTIEQTIYDSLGRVYQQSVPYQTTAYYTTNTFDTLNRVTQSQRPKSASDPTPQTIAYSFKGRTIITTDPQSKTSTRVTQVTGAVGRSMDNNSYYQDFAYDAFGSLLTVKDSSSPINTLFSATYAYGVSSMQMTASDIDRGSSSYVLDALGELKSSTDAKNQTVTFSSSDPNSAYDPLGRPVTRTEKLSSGAADLTATWTWGASASSHNIRQLQSISAVGAATYAESYSFDSNGRPLNTTITPSPIGAQSFDLTYSSTTGLLATLTYPTTTNSCRVQISYAYQNGFLKTLTDSSNAANCGSTGTVFWTDNTVNPMGEVTQETLGNGVVTNRVFDGVTGWMSSTQAGVGGGSGLLNLSYLYDLVGNVTQRAQNALTETACYDNVYRLDHTTLTGICTGATTLQLNYDAMGNIASRSDVNAGATWTYDSVHKHQVKTAGTGNSYSYDANGNMSVRNGNSITWSSYNYPLTINATGESTSFDYGPTHQYWRQNYSGSGGSETTYYLGKLLERVDDSTGSDYRHYIVANGEQVAIYSRKSAGTNAVRYTLEDNQGSYASILTSTGTTYVNESFAPFGARRKPTDWSGPPPVPPVSGDITLINGVTRTGYTGQIMLGSMGLIHMNGRVMDSVTGRFLSADPYVSEPGDTQNYNRYSYVYNNPITNIDPSGFCEGASVSCPNTNLAGTPSDPGVTTGDIANGSPVDPAPPEDVPVTACRNCDIPWNLEAIIQTINVPERLFSDRFLEVLARSINVKVPAKKSLKRQDPRCHSKLPDGKTVSQNVRELQQHFAMEQMAGGSGLDSFAQWLYNVWGGGPQDYKLSRQPGSEAMGNFNLGATGTVFFRDSPVTLHSGAGIYQLIDYPQGSDGGIPGLMAPHGDAWDDWHNIDDGINGGC